MATATATATATAVPIVTATSDNDVVVTSEEMSRHVKDVLQNYTNDHNNGSTLSLQNDHSNRHYTSGLSVAVPVRKSVSTRTGLGATKRSASRIIQMTEYKPITFDHKTQFSIRNNWFRKSNNNGGDHGYHYCPTTEITGGPKNSNEVMFTVTRIGEEGKLCVFKDVREAVPTDTKFDTNTPLLLMRYKKGHLGGHKIELCRVGDSVSNPNHPELWRVFPVCTIERKFCNYSIINLYDIELVGPLSNVQNNDSYLDCKGSLPKKMNLFNENMKDNGVGVGGGNKSKKLNKVASLEKKLFRSHWKLNIAEGEDVLLYIGINCAIDRIRQEFEWGVI